MNTSTTDEETSETLNQNESNSSSTSVIVDPLYPFVFGLVSIIVTPILAIFIPTPSSFQLAVFAILLGLGGAGFSTALSGWIQIKSKGVTAGGSLAVFVFICYFIINVTSPTI